MAGDAHNIAGEISYRLLPAWQRRRWQPDQHGLESIYCTIPDKYYGNERQYAKYCRLPNKKLITHALANSSFDNFPSFTCDLPDYDNNLYLINYYLKKIVTLLERKEDHEAAVFAGTFAHYLQDSVWPCHMINNSLLPLLMPFPKGEYWNLHRILDSSPDIDRQALMECSPVLLGLTVEEAAFNLLNMLYEKAKQSMGSIVPAVQAVYKRDFKEKNRILTRAAENAVDLTVSSWYTAFCIAEKRFKKHEAARLNILHLSDVPPFNRFQVWQKYGEPLDLMSHDPYMFEPLKNFALQASKDMCKPMKTIPLSIIVERNGKLLRQIVKNGFGAAGKSRITFRVDGRIHPAFRTAFGIHSMIKSSEKEIFRIYTGTDPDKLKERYCSGPVSAGEPAKKVDLKLNSRTKYLMLSTEGLLKDKLQIVWADPILVRSRSKRG